MSESLELESNSAEWSLYTSASDVLKHLSGKEKDDGSSAAESLAKGKGDGMWWVMCRWVFENMDFNKNYDASVFETTIR